MSPLLSWDVDPLRSKACHIGWNATPWSHTRSHQLGNRSGCLRSMEIFASVFFSRFFGWDSESQFERQMPETLANLFCEEMMFLFHILYTYTYTLGAGGSPGTPAPRGFIYMKLGWGWGGVGMVTFLELAHMVGATQVMGLGWGWGGDDNVPCTCTHGRCYASHGIGVGWGGDDFVPWTCTHGRYYAMS